MTNQLVQLTDISKANKEKTEKESESSVLNMNEVIEKLFTKEVLSKFCEILLTCEDINLLVNFII